jgi:hypothetical protein
MNKSSAKSLGNKIWSVILKILITYLILFFGYYIVIEPLIAMGWKDALETILGYLSIPLMICFLLWVAWNTFEILIGKDNGDDDSRVP